MIDLDQIERVAKAAQERSPGPWRLVHLGKDGFRAPVEGEDIDYIWDSAPKPEGFDDYDGGTWDGNRVLETDSGYYEPKGVTAEHIATCSPDVVLALVARIRELEGRARKVYEVIEGYENENSEGLFRCEDDAREHIGNLQLGNRLASFRVIERSIVGKP